MIKLTVVICTHNRHDLLLKVLDSIYSANHPKNTLISILVIVNACTDKTIESLINYNKNIKNRSIELKWDEVLEPGKSKALNRALSLCNSEWICFIDDDHRLDYNYFKSVCAAIENHPSSTIICGQVIPDWTGAEPSWVHDQSQYKITPYPIPNFNLGDSILKINSETALPGGGNLIIKRSTFELIGNFSEDLGPRGGNLVGSEDTEFILRAIRKNQNVIYCPDIKQYHYVDHDHLKLPYLIKKSFYRNKSFTSVTKSAGRKLPLYLLFQLTQYLFKILTRPTKNAIRFHITKAAGIIGQISAWITN